MGAVASEECVGKGDVGVRQRSTESLFSIIPSLFNQTYLLGGKANQLVTVTNVH